MMRKLMLLCVGAVICLSFAVAYGQDAQDEAFVMAVVAEGQLVITGDGTPIIVDIPLEHGVMGFAWRDDGAQLAVMTSADNGLKLYLVDATNGEWRQLNTPYLEAFTPTFTEAGALLYVAEGDNRVLDPDVPYRARLMQDDLSGGEAVEIGRFELILACEGGAVFAPVLAYWFETGFGANAPMLRETPHGILHSRSCGGEGYALFDIATGEDRILAEDLARGVLSAEENTLTALQVTFNPPDHTYALVQVDLATGVINAIETAHQPEQIGVGADGAIYYSSVIAAYDVADDLSEDELETLLDSGVFYQPLTLPTREMALYRLDATGEETLLYQNTVYAIARIHEVRNGAIVFSEVANIGGLVESILAGQPVVQPIIGDVGLRLVTITDGEINTRQLGALWSRVMPRPQ